jgi:hypothetical protein
MDKTITKQRAILTLFLLMVLLFCVSCTKKERILDETAHNGLTVQIVGKDEVYGEALLLQKETEERQKPGLSLSKDRVLKGFMPRTLFCKQLRFVRQILFVWPAGFPAR